MALSELRQITDQSFKDPINNAPDDDDAGGVDGEESVVTARMR